MRSARLKTQGDRKAGVVVGVSPDEARGIWCSATSPSYLRGTHSAVRDYILGSAVSTALDFPHSTLKPSIERVPIEHYPRVLKVPPDY